MFEHFEFGVALVAIAGGANTIRRTIVWIQIIDNKGIDVILEALLILARDNRVPPRGLLVEINGGNRQYASPAFAEKIGRQLEQLKKLGNSLIEIRDNGPYDRYQLAERMASIDWVLVPSTWWEIFGLVVSEAWMFGRPVIASSIAALKERVTPGVNGYTFPARDSRALAELIATLAGNPSKWTAASAGIELPMTDIDMFEAYITVWGEFASKHRRSRPAAADRPPDLSNNDTAPLVSPKPNIFRRQRKAADVESAAETVKSDAIVIQRADFGRS